jgi:prolyl oligopeptidase
MKKRLAAAALCLAAPAGFAAAPPPPVAAVHSVVTNYYGTSVTDNYRWMEAPDNPALAAFMKGQNAYTRTMLDSLPGRAMLLKDIATDNNLGSGVDGFIIAGGKYFYVQTLPGQNSGKLYVRDPATGKATLLVDPDKFGAPGSAQAINFFQPSLDGKYAAYGVSAGGSESATLRVIETATGKDQGVAIDRVDGDNDEFLPVWWLPDDSMAYYRLQKLGTNENPADFYLKSRVWLHHLGQNPSGDGDTPVFGYNVDPAVTVAPDQDALVMTFPGCDDAFGVLTENESNNVIDAIYTSPMAALAAGKPVWKQIVVKGDDITQFDAGANQLFLLTYQNAPRYKILETDLTAPDVAHARTVVPQGDAVISAFGVAKDALYVNSVAGGYSQITRLPLQNGGTAPAQTVALPFAAFSDGLMTNELMPGGIFPLKSWTRATLDYRYDPSTDKMIDTGIHKSLAAYTAGLVSKEVMATSYDGTLVPLSIVMKADTKLDGKNPTLLEGYGSYGITLNPGLDPGMLPWFNRGGIYAVAHVRGGGWLGEDWHKAGMKLTKINTIFDFIACAQYLEDHGYTSPAYLAGEGGSAGGITIGGAITWRPDLFAAAIDSHGDTDALRMEFTANGPPNIEEFGSVTTEPGFHGLYAMSAYAHVRDGVKYPAVLLETGANDPRVEPWTVTKMAARLQAASASGKPILLRVDYDSGHGIGDTKAQDNATLADELSFILWQTGDKDFQPTQ